MTELVTRKSPACCGLATTSLGELQAAHQPSHSFPSGGGHIAADIPGIRSEPPCTLWLLFIQETPDNKAQAQEEGDKGTTALWPFSR